MFKSTKKAGKVAAPLDRKSRSKAVSRRLAMAMPLTLPLAIQAPISDAAPQAAMDDATLAELLVRAEAASSAFVRGDMKAYLELIKIAPDFTLMQPFGGPFTRGFDTSSEHLAQIASYFQDGEVKMELVQSYVSGDMVVLAVIEWGHGKVGGLPDQEWPLRVTLVYRREGPDWLLLHRHADPLVHKITLEQLAALARG
ncbi:nuclear transport factor 2 family protein [Mesorhizobium sp. WSM4884]|uniref:YybH family protein n=1 Tax=Mesorhizobium sp. WSM4884 TaxID=3038542 RepID=UPI0024167F41|nr:nuclear transport factor 2 family protein [Mesorhizobium sp. WSM4884]MDG4883829.1 nuclear transport factor 2 family protein [Mesorhizobium sp. WSM4884]